MSKKEQEKRYKCLVELYNDDQNLWVQEIIFVWISPINVKEKWWNKYLFVDEPILIEEEVWGNIFSWFWKYKLWLKDLLWLFKRLGWFQWLPFSKKIEILKRQVRWKWLKKVVFDIEKTVNQWWKISKVFEKKEYKNVIKPYVSQLIRIGEQTWKEEEVFSLLAEKLEIQKKLISKIRGALIYPVFILVAVIGITIFLMLFMIPNFKNIFKWKEDLLPTITQTILNISDYLQVSWWYLLWYIVVSWFVLYKLFKNIYTLRKLLFLFLLKIPVIWPIIKKTYETFLLQIIYFGEYAIEVWSETFTKEHLWKFLEESMSNPIYRENLLWLSKYISRWEAWIWWFLSKKDDLFSFEMISYIEYWEESLTLKKQANDLYKENIWELFDFYEWIWKIIEPFLIILLWILVWWIAWWVFYWIFSISNTV